MAFQIKTFKELISMSKEKLEETLVPLRVRAAKAKADGIAVDLETKMLDLEAKIHKACAEKELNFLAIADMMDEYELLERRHKQVEGLIFNLFPAE